MMKIMYDQIEEIRLAVNALTFHAGIRDAKKQEDDKSALMPNWFIKKL